MAGLLAGCMFRADGQIYESANRLPNNHHALLRFRSNIISTYLNIPFTEVSVMKMTKPWRNPVADAMAYSEKCTGRRTLRSILTAQDKVEQRYIAPPDFIQEMERHQINEVRYGTTVDLDWLRLARDRKEPVISTMPMPVLMGILGYQDDALKFEHTTGLVLQVELPQDTDVCATIYYPQPDFDVSRAALTGGLLQIECPVRWAGPNVDAVAESWTADQSRVLNSIVQPVLSDFGLDDIKVSYTVKRQRYAKILPVDDRARKRFIMWATDNWGIYSLGRFAVWKPGLLLDDVFHDIQAIQRMMAGTNYEGKKS